MYQSKEKLKVNIEPKGHHGLLKRGVQNTCITVFVYPKFQQEGF